MGLVYDEKLQVGDAIVIVDYMISFEADSSLRASLSDFL
jgi:hypothetical protein